LLQLDLDAKSPKKGVSWLMIAALIVPLIQRLLLLFFWKFASSRIEAGIIYGTLLVTAGLLALDWSHCPPTDLRGRPRESNGMAFTVLLGVWWFCSLSGIWAFVYPWVYYRRSQFGGKNLTIAAVVIGLFFLFAPACRYLVNPDLLPPCDDPQITRLLRERVREFDLGTSDFRIGRQREVSYDPVQKTRQ
jgi:hypothetical protein